MRLSSNCRHHNISLFLLAVIKDRPVLDSGRVQTMVYNQPSSISGQVTSVDIFARATGRRLKLGIYRPEGKGNCRFKLVQEYVVDSVPVGRSTVKLTDNVSVQFPVVNQLKNL